MTKNNLSKIVVVLGPTGSGKSGVAMKLCQQFNGAIISADSRQVYRGLDIGTGKEVGGHQVQRHELGWTIDGIEVYGYDLVDGNDEFSISHYEKIVFNSILPRIQREGKIPFLVGGTGFYIRSIIDGVETAEIPPDLKLRQELEDLYKHEGVESLWQRLKEQDPARASAVDTKNYRRIIRAIEISTAVKNGFQVKTRTSRFELLMIGLDWERDDLYHRVDLCIDQMLQNGLLEEIESLLDKGLSWNLPSLHTIGYVEFKPYFEGNSELSNCVQQLKWNTHAYIRRQLTWFRKDKRIHWIKMGRQNFRDKDKLSKLVSEFLS